MRTITALGTAALAMLACAGSLKAHHSISMIEIATAVWVRGTVVRYQPINPHAMIDLEETREDGRVQRWTIEGPFPGRLTRILNLNGMVDRETFLNAGDVIDVCGFFPKASGSSQGPPSDAAPPPPFIHGHVLVMPDGRMQSWGPYGKLDNCIRKEDRAQPWLAFLNRDPLAREFWCNVPTFVGHGSTAPKEVVDDINRLMNDPCG
jgi:hypothetical protein